MCIHNDLKRKIEQPNHRQCLFISNKWTLRRIDAFQCNVFAIVTVSEVDKRRWDHCHSAIKWQTKILLCSSTNVPVKNIAENCKNICVMHIGHLLTLILTERQSILVLTKEFNSNFLAIFPQNFPILSSYNLFDSFCLLCTNGHAYALLWTTNKIL